MMSAFIQVVLVFVLFLVLTLDTYFRLRRTFFFPGPRATTCERARYCKANSTFPYRNKQKPHIKSLDHQIVLQFRLNPWNFSRKKNKLNFHSVPLTYTIYPIVHGSLQFISFYTGFYIGFLAITIINCCCCGCRKKINEMK